MMSACSDMPSLEPMRIGDTAQAEEQHNAAKSSLCETTLLDNAWLHGIQLRMEQATVLHTAESTSKLVQEMLQGAEH